MDNHVQYGINLDLLNHMATTPSIDTLINDAKAAEVSGDLSTAVHKYEQVLKKDKKAELVYTRLMILYRKLKQPRQELRIINTGIRNFQQIFKERTKKAYKKNSRRISYLSNAIIKSLRLNNERSENFYEPAPIPKWKHRKSIVLHKIQRADKR